MKMTTTTCTVSQGDQGAQIFFPIRSTVGQKASIMEEDLFAELQLIVHQGNAEVSVPRAVGMESLGQWLLAATPLIVSPAFQTVTTWGLVAARIAMEAAMPYATQKGSLPPEIACWVREVLMPALNVQCGTEAERALASLAAQFAGL